jgi:hypothetical protein
MFSPFDQVEYCNVDSDNIDRYVLFYPVLEFIVSDFLSNNPGSLPLWASEQLSFLEVLQLLVNYGKITVLQITVV